ncbi:MAG: hypothetical protein U0572_18630 [Phycisphaerales bacterium]
MRLRGITAAACALTLLGCASAPSVPESSASTATSAANGPVETKPPIMPNPYAAAAKFVVRQSEDARRASATKTS